MDFQEKFEYMKIVRQILVCEGLTGEDLEFALRKNLRIAEEEAERRNLMRSLQEERKIQLLVKKYLLSVPKFS